LGAENNGKFQTNLQFIFISVKIVLTRLQIN